MATPTESAVSKQLLAALRERTGVPELDYAEPLQRITGGYETLTYGFRLRHRPDIPEHLDRPLILRLFSGEPSSGQSRRESAFQNSLNGLGYPVPAVREQFDTGIDGRSFNVMDRIEGESLLNQADLEPANIARMIDWFAKIHVRLHQVDSAPVIDSVVAAGFPLQQFSVDGRLKYLGRYFEGEVFEKLRPGMEWLKSNRPTERGPLAVCHGDFHPGNIMVEGDRVTGVIDWPGAAFAEPEFDVATSLVLIKVGAVHAEPDVLPMVLQIADLYLDRYVAMSPISREKVAYYEVLRSFRAFTRGTALRTAGLPTELAPRDEYPWSSDIALQLLQRRLNEITGLDLPLPDGVQPLTNR